jgi:CRP-like cAMP-binding protein
MGEVNPRRPRALGTRIPVAPGKVLAREGRAGLELGIILDGVARVTRDGREVAWLEPGQGFGAFALVRGVPNPVTIVACTPMTLAVLHVGEFWSAYAARPEFRDDVDRQIDEHIDALHELDYTLAS